jgi:hypothetical protein
MSTVTLPSIRSGDTLEFFITLASSTITDIRSEVRDSADTLYGTLTITPTNVVGQYYCTCETVGWPAGELLTDIRWRDDGKSKSSSTIYIPIEGAVTHV